MDLGVAVAVVGFLIDRDPVDAGLEQFFIFARQHGMDLDRDTLEKVFGDGRRIF